MKVFTPGSFLTGKQEGSLRVGSGLFLMAMGLLFILRGIQIQCLYPPLEGPDEYQHIARMLFAVEEEELPVYGKSFVPTSLYPDLIDNPHSQYGWEQTKAIGCLPYGDFYERKTALNPKPSIALYQAQHPPVYYALFSPVFIRLKSAFSFRGAVYALRMLNIALGALALVLLLLPMRVIFEDDGPFMAAALAVSLSPMYMIYVSRVTNDPLAMVFGGIAVWQLLKLAGHRRPVLRVTVAAAALGLGMTTKLTVMGLLPAGVAYICYLAMRAVIPWRTALLCSSIMVALPLIIYSPVMVKNILNYGIPFASQDAIINANKGRGLLDALKQIRLDHVKTVFFHIFIRGNLWTSGWTFLSPRYELTQTYVYLLAGGFSGAVIYTWRALVVRKQTGTGKKQALFLSVLVVFFTFGAVYGQILSSILAFGKIATVAYYVMPAYPALLTCCFAFAGSYGRVAAFSLSMAFAALFIITEYHSLLAIAVPQWAATDCISIMAKRLTRIHPLFPAPRYFWPMTLFCIMGTALLAAAALRAFVRSDRCKQI